MLQSLQMYLALNGAGQLFAGTVLSPHSWFPSVKDELRGSVHCEEAHFMRGP